MRDKGDRAADRQALGDVLWFAAIVTAAALVTGVPAMLGIEALQLFDAWPTPEPPDVR